MTCTKLRTIKQRPQWACWQFSSCDQSPCGTASDCLGCPLAADTEAPIPIRASGCGTFVAPDDAATWATFDEAMLYHERSDTDTDGVALMLADSLIVTTLDDCRDPNSGAIDDWATGIIEEVDTYAEVSPDGTGLRLIATANLAEPLDTLLGISRSSGAGTSSRVRMFDVGYLVYTGRQVSGTPDDVQARFHEIQTAYEAHVEISSNDECALE